jgi:hypothetical protein
LCFRRAQPHLRVERAARDTSQFSDSFSFISHYITAISSYMSSYYGQVYSCIESSCMGIELPHFCFPLLVPCDFSHFRLLPARFHSLLPSDLQLPLYF